ncbi:MAG: hypothetical protein J5819_00395 [Eubacterium sp.]|nr:hypothetical protein [Eubacterium sp.]
MDTKLANLICGILGLVALLVFFIWGQFFHGYSISWISFVVSGIACAIIRMIANYNEDKKKENEDD